MMVEMCTATSVFASLPMILRTRSESAFAIKRQWAPFDSISDIASRQCLASKRPNTS